MPSPCEFVPEQDTAAVVHYGQVELPQRSSATRVIPAIAGGVFAGLLLVGLGCTPLFKPQAAKAKPEIATIVTASSAAGSVDGMTASRTPSPQASAVNDTVVAASSSTPSVASGVPAITYASSSAPPSAAQAPASPSASLDNHRFAVLCDPPHGYEDRSAPRPETVMLQGIMAGQSSKAALMNGTLYREGDRFGSALCPWTVAMIDAAGVRIEKAFGDRVCGVTIHLPDAKPQVAKAPAAPSTKSAKPRASVMSSTKSR